MDRNDTYNDGYFLNPFRVVPAAEASCSDHFLVLIAADGERRRAGK